VRIYVGVLYSDENEFESCIKSIEAQDYPDFKYFVFKGLAKKEAHETLFNNFCESGFDVLVKVDADMVLIGNDLFSYIQDNLVENMRTQNLQFPVYDYFSDQPIWGLNVYRGIKPQESNDVFTDIIKVDNWSPDLKIAATHCQDPTFFQSFHYGVHKAIKVAESYKLGLDKKVEYYKDIIKKTYESCMETREERRAICIAGARFAVAYELGAEHLDYTNPYLLNCFNQMQDCQGKGNLCS
jgi:hypothetical protein